MRLERRTAGIALAVLAAGAGAFAISNGVAGSGSLGESAKPAVRSRALSIELPSGWLAARAGDDGSIPFRDAVAADSAGGHARLVAGMLGDPQQLRPLTRAAAGAGAVRRTTRIGGLELWRWTGVRIDGAPVTLFVGYTSRGPLVATCGRPGGGHTADCSAPLSKLTLTAATPVPLATVERVRQELYTEMATLERTWISGRARLAAATLAFQQAGRATDLEAAFRTASAGVAHIEAPPGTADLRPVVQALDRTAAGYAQLSAAIVNADNAGYDQARAAIVQREAELRTAADAAAIP
jgi:hypothetical protein